MRTFLQTTAGGTFFQVENVTVITYKYYIELVFRASQSTKWYAVVVVEYDGPDQVRIFCNWNGYFNRINKLPDPSKVLKRLKPSCPQLTSLIYGKAEYNVLSWNNTDGTIGSGVGKTIKTKVISPFVATAVSEEVFNKASSLAKYCVDLYNEIMKDCPLQAWKDDLKEKLF